MKVWLSRAIVAVDEWRDAIDWAELAVRLILVPSILGLLSCLFALITCGIRYGDLKNVPDMVFARTVIGWFIFCVCCAVTPWWWKKAVHWAKQPERMVDTLRRGR